MSKVNYLINYLLSERDDLGRIEIPETEQDKFRLYRSLVNRPLAKLNGHIKITNTNKQRKPKGKTLSSVTVSF